MAFKLDFDKLRDPVLQEQRRIEREAEAAKAEAHERDLRRELNRCLEVVETLESNQRGLVRSCQLRLNQGLGLSEAQEKWLLNIAAGVRKALEPTLQALIDRHAKGNPLGEHPGYPRKEWPEAADGADHTRDYWFWVMRCVGIFGS